MKLNVYVLTYNRSAFLSETISSILNQTYRDFSLYILDNCSTDDTPEVVSAILDPRVNYIRHEKNIGGAGNINFAIHHCKADYFVIFHDDDLMLPDFLEKEIEVLENEPEVAAVGGNAEQFGAVSVLKLFDLGEKEYYRGNEYLIRYLKTGGTLVFPSVMYRGKFIKENSLEIKTEPGPCCDVVMLADIARCGGVLCQLSDVIIRYRIHENQDSSMNYFSMHVRLFEYLKNSEFYGPIYLEQKGYYPEKYQAFSKLLFFRWFNKQIDDREAEETFENLEQSLLIDKRSSWRKLFDRCRKDKSFYHLLKRGYSLYRGISNRG